MTFDSITTVLYTSLFLVPGYIIKSIVDTITPSRKKNDVSYMLMCLLYSLINFLVVGWSYPIIFEKLDNKISMIWIILIGINLFTSLCIASIFCFIEKRKTIQKFYRNVLGVDYIKNMEVHGIAFYTKITKDVA